MPYNHWRQSGVKSTSATSGIWGCFFGAHNICTNLCTDFRGGAKKQPVPWPGGTGYNGALDYNNIALFLTHITLAPTQWKECKFFLIRLYIFKNRCLPDRLIKFLYLHTFCNVNYCLLKMSQIIRILGDFFFDKKFMGMW